MPSIAEMANKGRAKLGHQNGAAEISYKAPVADLPQLRSQRNGAPSEETVVQEARVFAELDGPTVALGADFDFKTVFYNLEGEEVSFHGLQLLQIEWDAQGLVAADTTTLSLYRRETRAIRNLVARFSGTSPVAGTWKSIQANQLIEYFDGEGDSQIYGRLTNATGNTGPCTFHVLITARRVS